MSSEKKCLSKCPYCNAEMHFVEWKNYDGAGEVLWQNATCKKCGKSFREIYTYHHTEIDE